MRHRDIKSPIDWAKRVNRSWLVRSNLNDNAEAWLTYLELCGDGRLIKSCEFARAMCQLRDPEADPKPWFYVGLFQLATAPEATRFLATHRVTKSLVPAMENDSEVRLWLDRVGPETLTLLDRLRQGLRQIC